MKTHQAKYETAMIRDPYINAGEGQVILTANMLFGMVTRRTDGWRKYGIRTEA